VPTRKLRRPLAALAVAASVGLVGCASGSPQTGAATFRDEHAAVAARLAATAKSVQLEVSRLSPTPTRAQVGQLARAAAEVHGEADQAGAWSVAGRGEEGAEEEDLPRAETQVTEGASELASAMSALQSYARAPSAAALTGYQSKLANAQAEWNEGIAQLWYLAHASDPPTI
jgi:hypothetical protein